MNLHVSRMQEDPQKQELPSDGTEKLRTALETLRAGMAELRRLKEGLELHHRSLVARLWALRESEARYKGLASVAFDGVAVHFDGILLQSNRSFDIIFGYKDGDTMGRQSPHEVGGEEQ